MKREHVVELAYKYGFDGADGVFQWNDEQHYNAGFLKFEQFVNEFEEAIRRDCAILADEMGHNDVAYAIMTAKYE